MSRYRVALILAAVSLLATAGGLVLLLSGAAVAAPWIGSLAQLLLTGLAPASLAGGVGVAWLPTRARPVVLTLSTLGFAAASVVALAWSAGFDAADAGVPPGPVAGALAPATVVALVALALAIVWTVTAALHAVVPTMHRALRLGIAALAAVAGGPLLLVAAALGYLALLPAAITLCAVLVVRDARARPAAQSASLPKPALSAALASSAPPTGVSEAYADVPPVAAVTTTDRAVRARRWAWASLAMTATTLVGGLIAGLALAGSDGATLAMGLMSAAGHLAAIPLIIAVTLLAVPLVRAPFFRHPGARGTWLTVFAAGAGIGGGSIWLAVGALSGDQATAGFAVIAASVSLWLAVLTAARVSLPMSARVVLAALVGIGGGVLYILFAVGTAGGVLALASGYLAFGGVSALARPRRVAAL